MVRSFIWRQSSTIPLLLCLSTCMLTAAYGMVQSDIGSAGNTPLHMADGSKNVTVQAGQMKLIAGRTATAPGPRAKQPPVRPRVTPPSNKHMFPPVSQVSPGDAQKLEKLFKQMISGQKRGPTRKTR